ncbi:MAG TPA: class A beta-lactamase-related serine hydrolase, partial [Phycisphaerales bacterium]|nr:class A beta-lactamase-related serine hydrolase [Phycisphaerales bacterium]
MRWILCVSVGLAMLGGFTRAVHGQVRLDRDKRRNTNDEIQAAIAQVVWREIRAGSFPGAVVLVGRGNRIVYFDAFGDRCVQPRRLMQKNTLFDLASLTKPLATAPAVLLLAERGQLDLDDHVRVYLPTFACGG